MSNETLTNTPQFGDEDYNYNLVKVGDKDAQGEIIISIYYTTNNMIIYRTKGYLIVTYSDCPDRFSVLSAIKQEINNLLQYKVHQDPIKNEDSSKREEELENLRTLYAPQLSHAYQMCYFESYKEGILMAEKVKESIENRIKSKTEYAYFKHYLKYLAIVFIFLSILITWNNITFLKSYSIPNWLTWHLYIAIAGIIGSFISAKEKIASKTIDFNFPIKRTILDVKFRMLLGGIFGILTVWLVFAKIIMGILAQSVPEKLFSTTSCTPAFSEAITILLIGIVGGFSERLVPDTLRTSLNKASIAEEKEEEAKMMAKKIKETTEKTSETESNHNQNKK